MAEFLHIHPDNPQPRLIAEAVKVLRKGGVIIYPTDTIYGIGCDITNSKAIDQLCRIKGIKAEKKLFSFICRDLSRIADFARVSTPVFKLLKKALPGPYTFILDASSAVPKLLKQKKKTVGIRIPDNRITQALVQELGNPIISASLKTDDEILEYPTDPQDIYDRFHKVVDIIIDGGPGGITPSTVISCENNHVSIIREGVGPVDIL